MEEAKQFVRVLQVADPGIPCAVLETVAEAGKEQSNRKDRKGRVKGDYDVANQTEQGCKNGDAALAVMVMNEVAGEGSSKVGDKRGQEEQ